MLQLAPTSVWQYRPFCGTFSSMILLIIVVIIMVIVVSYSDCEINYSSCSAASFIYTYQCSSYGTTYCCNPSFS